MRRGQTRPMIHRVWLLRRFRRAQLTATRALSPQSEEPRLPEALPSSRNGWLRAAIDRSVPCRDWRVVAEAIVQAELDQVHALADVNRVVVAGVHREPGEGHGLGAEVDVVILDL